MRWDTLEHAYLEKWIGALGLKTEWNAARRAAGISELRPPTTGADDRT